jgi:beta-glucuronidase
MKTTYLFSVLIFISEFICAQNNNLIQNAVLRHGISLNGVWKIIIDPYENGYFDYRLAPGENGYFKNAKPKSKSDLIEYDFDKSESLNVPGDWNSQQEKLFLYEGTIWYKKSFDYTIQKNRRVYLYFGAVNYSAEVYVNGKKAGSHTGGFTSFNFEITDKIKDGSNFIVVKVDNKRLREGVPTVNTDWWNYGGITRDVRLIEVPENFVQDYSIQLEKGTFDRIAATIRVNGIESSRKVRILIPGLKIDAEVKTDNSGLASTVLNAEPILWSPESPKLYDIQIICGEDSVADKIGFRTIETRGKKILLNGKEIFLRGICIHEEAPIRNGRAYSKEDAAQLIGWAKELGCNFVRLAHYPHNENMIREAEKSGILVWSEIPVYWTILWENESTYANASNQLTEMIDRDKNRAPVILWSVANETPINESRLIFLRKLISLARSLDPTRLITAATEIHYINPDTIMIDDPLGNYLDVIGCNEYIGWYDGLPQKADSINWKIGFDKPLIFSEWGGGAKQGLHADSLTRWSEEFQESVYKHQISMHKKIPFLEGMTPWILMDFRSPRRPLAGIQDFYNRKGLISNLGEKKKAFFILRDYYNSIKDK